MPTLARSYLFVPGHRPERIDKAVAGPADAVIVDLEDAVPAAEKAAARRAVADWLQPGRSVLLRINPDVREEIELASRPGVAGVVLPKVDNPQQLEDIARALPSARPLFPMIETAAGLDRARAIAGACDSVVVLIFGALDFCLDLGLDPTALDPFRAQLVLASRLAGLPGPVDGVTPDFNDPAVAARDARRARDLGFSGKSCIHPAQLPGVNEAFIPSREEREWATRVIAAAYACRGGAAAVRGEMIDRPVILRAERILARGGERGGDDERG